jgi:hypothetical protein
MARIVSKSRAGEDGAKPTALAGLPQPNDRGFYSAFRPQGETPIVTGNRAYSTI